MKANSTYLHYSFIYSPSKSNQKKRKRIQSPQVFENSPFLYSFWKAQGWETYVNAFYLLYQRNMNCSVFMRVFAVWESDMGEKSNVFFIIAFTQLILFAENPYIKKSIKVDFFCEFHSLYYLPFSEANPMLTAEISSDLKSAWKILLEIVGIFSYE